MSPSRVSKDHTIRLRTQLELALSQLKRRNQELKTLQDKYDVMKHRYNLNLQQLQHQNKLAQADKLVLEHQTNQKQKENDQLQEENDRTDRKLALTHTLGLLSSDDLEGMELVGMEGTNKSKRQAAYNTNAVGLLRSKIDLLLMQLEVLVREIGKTEKASEGHRDVVKAWFKTTAFDWRSSSLASLSRKLDTLDYNSFDRRLQSLHIKKSKTIDLQGTLEVSLQNLVESLENEIKSSKKDLHYKSKLLNKIINDIRDHDPSVTIPIKLKVDNSK